MKYPLKTIKFFNIYITYGYNNERNYVIHIVKINKK